jgi:hypothetical protein
MIIKYFQQHPPVVVGLGSWGCCCSFKGSFLVGGGANTFSYSCNRSYSAIDWKASEIPSFALQLVNFNVAPICYI